MPMSYHRRPKKPTKVVVAQQFRLVNTKGSCRASLYVDPKSDQPMLCLYDKQSDESRIDLGILPEGNPALEMFDRGGRKRLSLGLWDDDATLSFYDSEHEYPLVFLIAIDGSISQIRLSDGEYAGVQLFAGTNSIEAPDAQAGVILSGKDGPVRQWLVAQEESDAESSTS